MSKSNRYGLILWSLNWVIIALTSKPVMAQKTKIASVPESSSVSSKAIDLLPPAIELQQYFTDVQTRTYQLGQVNLEKFCQDFPYNSRCRDATSPTPVNPGMETEPDSIPVPVPPPEPPSESEQQSDRPQTKSGWAIVPEISTLGLGGHVVRRIIPQINARVGINAFSLGLDDAIDTDVDYEADLNLFSVSTLADIHPFKNSGFRISTGLIFGNSNFDGTADITESVVDELEAQAEVDEDIIEQLRNIDEIATVDTDVDINNGVAPYLGIGGGNAVGSGKGFGFWWNLGVVFSGSPDVDLSTDLNSDRIRNELDEESAAVAEQVIEETQQAVNEVTEDEEDDIQDNLDLFDIYPVLSLGISYQF